MADATILLISDDKLLAEQVKGVSKLISRLEFVVWNRPDAASRHEGWDRVSLVLIHQIDPGCTLEVSQLLQRIAVTQRPVATIVLAEAYDAEQGIDLLRMGVADYLGLPLDSARLRYLLEVLTIRHRRGPKPVGAGSRSIRGVSEDGARFTAVEVLAEEALTAGPGGDDPTILDGDTPEVATLVEQIRRVAPQSATILLGGETGTGKTRLARQIHNLSGRRDEPFLVVNCETLTSSSVERDLFGHVQGAFQGAATDRVGKFAEVGRGTLFLDGIDALPPAIQTKLLRVVDDRAFEPLGATETVPLRARLIAASNRPLDEEVAERRFRSDLYYRLNVVGLELPPLRDRRDAIAPLAHRFLNEFASDEGRNFDPISADALQALQNHDWPGNVRELRNVVARCVALCPDRSIRREDLPPSVLDANSRITTSSTRGTHPILTSTFPRSFDARTQGQNELARITEALEKHGNNRLRTAGELGISRMTLYKKLYKYGLMQPSTPQEHF